MRIKPHRIVVIGGGITGLAAARKLIPLVRQLPHLTEIRILEASPNIGGNIQTILRDGFLMEGGPDCFVSDKPRGIGLCKELGLESDIIPTRAGNRRSFIVKNGRLHAVPEGFYLMGPSKLLPMLTSPLLSLRGKRRLLAEPATPRDLKEDESLASFVRRRLGEEVLDRLAQPLLAGIYAADPETLSLRATFPQFLEMEEKHGSILKGLRAQASKTKTASGARYSLFVSLKHGLGSLVKRLGESFLPGTIQMGHSVREVRRTQGDGGMFWQVVVSNGDIFEADGVCIALPAHHAANLIHSEDAQLADLLFGIPYTGSATINLAFRRSDVRHPLNGFGFVVPKVEDRFLLACTFSNEKFEGRAPKGGVLLRAFAGGAHHQHVLLTSDSILQARALQDLHDFLGLRDSPLFSVIQRHERAMPQYLVGHLKRLKQIEERAKNLPGLVLAGNWQKGVGIPDCVESGECAAETLIADLKRMSTPS